MHVVLISPAWPLGFPNGIVTYVHNLRIGLRAAGHRVSVLSLHGDVDVADEVYPVKNGWRNKVGSIVRRVLHSDRDFHSLMVQAIVDSVLRLHNRCPVDVVEMEESFGWCSQVQNLLPMPVIVKLHGPSFLTLIEEERAQPESREKIDAESDALRVSRFVVSPSQSTLDSARRFVGQSRDWGRVIVNPVIIGERIPRWSRSSSDPNMLLFVGRFDKLKGGDLVVNAFRKLLDLRPGLTLLFAGPDRGVCVEGRGRMNLTEFVRSVLNDGQRERLKVLGAVSSDRVAELRASAAVTLICSRFDNQPNTVLEAFFQGCPVVAMESGGVAEVVKHRVTGLLAANGDIDDFCQQVLWMLDHPADAEAMGLAGRAYVQRVHDVHHVASQAISYYSEVRRQHRLENLHQGGSEGARTV